MPRFHRLWLILAASVVLAACGQGETPPPTQTPAPPTQPSSPEGSIPVSSLIGRVNTAWMTAKNYRVTSWTDQDETASAPPANVQSVEEVFSVPSSRQFTVVLNGVAVNTFLQVDGRVYMKGQSVTTALDPSKSPDTWVELDPRTATSDSPFAPMVSYVMAPLASPFAPMVDSLGSRYATPGETSTINGRSCTRYTFSSGAPDASQRYELFIDEQGLPCRFNTVSGGYTSHTEMEFNVPGLRLVGPVIATPAASREDVVG